MTEYDTRWVVEAVAAVVRKHRFAHGTERELQDGLASLFARHLDGRLEWEREVAVGTGDIVDFQVGRVGIEVKIGGSLSSVTRQLHRYAQHPSLDALVLITTKAQHRAVPCSIAGKPVRVVYIGGADL